MLQWIGRDPPVSKPSSPPFSSKYPEACVWQPTSNLLVIWEFFVEYTFIGIWVRTCAGLQAELARGARIEVTKRWAVDA